MDQYCTLYIIRHGQTDWNVKKITQGSNDIPLNEEGEKQARNFSNSFKSVRFDAVFSSDLIRAKKTAEIIALEKKLAVETTKLLRERRYGRFEGKKAEALDKLDKMKDALSKEERFKFKPYPDVESDEEIIGRLTTFLREISVSYLGKSILVITHGGMMRTLLNHLGVNLPHGAVGNSAYIKLVSDGVDFFIKETKGIKTNG